MRGESKSSPRRLQGKERAGQALQLRIAGYGWNEIAAQLGYASHTGPLEAVRDLLASRAAPDIDEYRKLSWSRLERVLVTIWPGVLRGEDKAIGRFIQINDQLNNLMGAYPKNTPNIVASVKVDEAGETTVGIGIAWEPDAEWMKAFAQAWDEIHPGQYDPAAVKELTNGAGDPTPDSPGA